MASPVVLDDEDHGQLPAGGEVQALEERALVRAAVARERDRDLIRPLHAGRESHAAHERRTAADDPVGAQHALGEVGDVHRPALAVAEAGRLAVDLGHHPLDVAALRDRVTVAAVGAGHVVVRPEVRAHARGDRLLAGVQVHEAGDLPRRELAVQALLELANRAHDAVGLEQLLPGELASVRVSNGGHRTSSC
jgi:hypothetical protein